MATLPQVGDTETQFPFRATQSELRILKELLAIVALRDGDTAHWLNEDLLTSRGITAAAACIAALKEELFPEEARLRRSRANAIKPLNGGPLRAHFDQTLETAALTIHAHIQSKADFESLLKRLQTFNFDEWQDLCSKERINAD